MAALRGRAAFFAAAREILAAEGADALTLAALCQRVYVSTGGFYYHFASMGEFVAAFAADWQARWDAVFARIYATPDPLARLEIAAETAIAMPVRLDAAIRAWAKTNDVLGAVVRGTDAEAVTIAREAFTELLGDPERAALLAHMSLALVVGLLMQDEPPDQDLYAACLLEWIRSCAGLQVSVQPGEGGAPAVRLHHPGPPECPTGQAATIP